jgi:hypothetical protein
MVRKHHAPWQGSHPALRIEQHATADEIVPGDQGWVWPVDRSVAQALQTREMEGFFSPSMHVHVYQHDRVLRLSSLRDEHLNLSPESYSIEGTVGRKQNITWNSNGCKYNTRSRDSVEGANFLAASLSGASQMCVLVQVSLPGELFKLSFNST